MVGRFAFLCLVALVSSTGGLHVPAALAQPVATEDIPTTDCDRQAAEVDDPDRQVAGVPGVPDDELNAPAAVAACERAVEQYPASRRLVFQLGRGYLKSGNLNGAVVRFHQAAEQGHVLAQTYLGTLYLEGTGVTRDEAQAVQWFGRSAEQGDAVAQYNLAVMLETGRGTAKDEVQAAAWYRKAAEQGFSLAQSSLGRLYAFGRGVAKDEAQAADWYRRAAEQGEPSGQYRLAALYAEGRGVGRDPDQALAWYRKAAEQNYLDAARQVATLEAAASAKPAPDKSVPDKPVPDTTAPAEASPAVFAPGALADGERPGRQRWLMLAVLGAIGVIVVLALAGLALRNKPQKRSVTRQLESLKMESLRLEMQPEPKLELKTEANPETKAEPGAEPKTALGTESKPASESEGKPADALSAFASQVEAIPPLPTLPAEAEARSGEEANDEFKTDTDGPFKFESGEPATSEAEPPPSGARAVEPTAGDKPPTDEEQAVKAIAEAIEKLGMQSVNQPDANEAKDEEAAPALRAVDAEPTSPFVAEAVEEEPAPPPPAMKRCSQCQNEIPPNDYFCCHGGARAIRFSDCQHDVRDNARFCPRCGAILRWSTPKAVAAGGSAATGT